MKKKLNKILVLFIVMIMVLGLCSSFVYGVKASSINNLTSESNSQTPVQKHGRLKLNGTDIVDQYGNKFQLRGISTHGLAWFPEYVNQDAFIYMRDEWKINTIRLAMYSDPNAGYNSSMHEKVKQGVEYAKNAGLYVIIDWHILSDGNPNIYKNSAIEFFREMANLYKDDVNIIYEICNEPNGDVQWERDIKPYANEVIREIRNIDKNAIIVVGTPTWSQDVDVVAQSPITGYENIMYTLHFYAATHKDYLRQKMQVALDAGLPIFVTEFGICDASGNGANDEQEANTWIETLDSKNISWICWNLSNKNESSAILSNTSKTTGWSNEELSQSGKWLVSKLTSYKEDSVITNNNNANINTNTNTPKNEENQTKTNSIENTTNTTGTTNTANENNSTQEVEIKNQNEIMIFAVSFVAIAVIVIIIFIAIIIFKIKKR